MVLLWSAMVGVTLLHYTFRSVVRFEEKASDATATAWFRLVVGLVFLVVQHGKQALVVVVIAYVGYRLAVWQRETRSGGSWLAWSYAVAVLLFKEAYRIQHWPGLKFLRPVFSQQHGGMYGWQLPANFLVLRIVSFMLDFQWAGQRADLEEDDEEKEGNDERDDGEDEEEEEEEDEDDPGWGNGGMSALQSFSPPPSPRSSSRSARLLRRRASSSVSGSSPPSTPRRLSPRQQWQQQQAPDSPRSVKGQGLVLGRAAADGHRPLEQYCLINYLSYMFYAPLYTAGPIMSFNAFVENTHSPQESEDPIRYGLRWLLCLGLMEALTSWFPFFATINSGLFPYLSCAELGVVAYMTLKMMWLKFLIVWRFFRLWALADGTLPPENMQRCMSNNCSLETFWKGWHSSFNLWIVRYMYKPLGGRDSRVWIVWPIFLFVAVWHDIEMKLLVWGLLNAFFYVVEVLAKRLAATPAFSRLPSSLLRAVVTLSGATYILVLVGTNLIGYAGLGVHGFAGMINKLVSWDGLLFFFVCYYLLSCAVAFQAFLSRVGLSSSSSSSSSTSPS